jgi:hypothetical protein
MVYFRDEENWTLYNDNFLKPFPSWAAVISSCAEIQQRPTLLFFERSDTRQPLRISSSDLRQLHSEVIRLDADFISQ